MNSTCTVCGHTQHIHFKFSHDKPTTEGWYWYNGVEYGQPIIMQIVRDGGVMVAIIYARKTGYSFTKEIKGLTKMSGQWSQRIPAPL